MKYFARAVLATCLALTLTPASVFAGSLLEGLDLTNAPPSPVAGQVIAQIRPLRLDDRCLPLTFRVNNTLDPVPNPLGEDFLSVAEATEVFQNAAQAWNDVPTAYSEVAIDGTTSNLGPTGFDQVNEITFRTDPNFVVVFARGIFTRAEEPIAFVRRTVLLADTTLPAGADLDRDGDPDTAAIATCADVDGDGDIEFPAGPYEAGTLFDLDILLSTGVDFAGTERPAFRFTADPDAIDDDPRSVDLYLVALQALGMAQGVGHSMIDQRNARDGSESVMFPFVDTDDPRAQRLQRRLDVEAVATLSGHYPEGSADRGLAALQPGDVPFDEAFGVITGEVFLGEDQPITGASVYAAEAGSNRMIATAMAGRTRWSTQPNGLAPTWLDPEFHVLNGRYRLIVPPGTYRVGVEAVDDHPAGHRHFNLETIAAFDLGIDRFDEDVYSGGREDAFEGDPLRGPTLDVAAGQVVEGVDIYIDEHRHAPLLLPQIPTATGYSEAAPGTYYAVRVPADEVDGATILGVQYLTALVDTSDVPRFGAAILTTGVVGDDGNARLDLTHPLLERSKFIGQDYDFTPLYAPGAQGLTRRAERRLADGQDLFLVLQVPERLQAPHPPLVGLVEGGPGVSFLSTDGETFVPDDVDYLFELILSPVD